MLPPDHMQKSSTNLLSHAAHLDCDLVLRSRHCSLVNAYNLKNIISPETW